MSEIFSIDDLYKAISEFEDHNKHSIMELATATAFFCYTKKLDKNATREIIQKLGKFDNTLFDNYLITTLLADRHFTLDELLELGISEQQQLYYLITFASMTEFAKNIVKFTKSISTEFIFKDCPIIQVNFVTNVNQPIFQYLLINSYAMFTYGCEPDKKLEFFLREKILSITNLEHAKEITTIAIRMGLASLVSVCFKPQFNKYYKECIAYHLENDTRQNNDCETFYSHRADKYHVFSSGYTLLHIAAYNDDVQFFQVAYEIWLQQQTPENSNIEYFITWSDEGRHRSNHPYETIFHTAARVGSKNIFQFFINQGLLEYKEKFMQLRDRDDTNNIMDYLHSHECFSTAKLKQYHSKQSYQECLFLFGESITINAPKVWFLNKTERLSVQQYLPYAYWNKLEDKHNPPKKTILSRAEAIETNTTTNSYTNVEFQEPQLSLADEDVNPNSQFPCNENQAVNDIDIIEAAELFCKTFKPTWNANFFTALFQDKNNPSNKLFVKLNDVQKHQLTETQKASEIITAVKTFIDTKKGFSAVNSQAFKVLQTSGLQNIVKQSATPQTIDLRKN